MCVCVIMRVGFWLKVLHCVMVSTIGSCAGLSHAASTVSVFCGGSAVRVAHCRVPCCSVVLMACGHVGIFALFLY